MTDPVLHSIRLRSQLPSTSGIRRKGMPGPAFGVRFDMTSADLLNLAEEVQPFDVSPLVARGRRLRYQPKRNQSKEEACDGVSRAEARLQPFGRGAIGTIAPFERRHATALH